MARLLLIALVISTIGLTGACGAGTGGSGTGGNGTGGGTGGHATGGTGGALTGAGGHATGAGGSGAGGQATGGSGGSGAGGHATGGTGGALGGTGGHATGGSGGALGGVGGHAAGGAGGPAGGGGAAGSGLFYCLGTVSPSYPCSTPGLICNESSESVQFCLCTSNGTWGCGAGGGVCAYEMTPGAPCDSTAVAALGGCKVSPASVCTCQSSPDGGATFNGCQDIACPIAQPTGTCDVRTTPAVECYYQAKAVTCLCPPVDAGVRRWKCNDQLTPDCPTLSPGNGTACTAFQPGANCSYPAGTCTCNANGSSQTWSCG